MPHCRFEGAEENRVMHLKCGLRQSGPFVVLLQVTVAKVCKADTSELRFEVILHHREIALVGPLSFVRRLDHHLKPLIKPLAECEL